MRVCFYCGRASGGHHAHCAVLRVKEMPRLQRIVTLMNAGEATSRDDVGYLVTRMNYAEELIERIKRFQPKVGPQDMTEDQVDDLEAWCEWKNSRRDENE